MYINRICRLYNHQKSFDSIVTFNFYLEIHSGLGQRVQSGLHGAQLDQVFVRENSNVFSFQIDQIHADFFRNSWAISNIGAGHLSEEFEMGLERFRFIRLFVVYSFHFNFNPFLTEIHFFQFYDSENVVVQFNLALIIKKYFPLSTSQHHFVLPLFFCTHKIELKAFVGIYLSIISINLN